MSRLRLILLTAVLALQGCTAKMAIPTEFPTPEPPSRANPLTPVEWGKGCRADFDMPVSEIVRGVKGRVGAAAFFIEAGACGRFDEKEQFPMQSVYKLPIAMTVLDKVRTGELALDEKIMVTPDDLVRPGQASAIRDQFPTGGEFSVDDLIRYAIVESDGTASDVLLRIAGGPGSVQDYLTWLGIEGMTVANSESEIGQDWQVQYENSCSPAAAVELLRYLWISASGSNPDGVTLEGSDRLLRYMADSKPGAKRLKGMLPNGTVVAHKTGTGGTRNGIGSALNDIGIIQLPNGEHVAIAVFIADSPAGEKTREAVIARIGKTAFDMR